MSLSFYNNDAIHSMVKDYIEQRLKRHGPLHYFYFLLNKRNPKEFLLISNYSDQWVDNYKKNNYQHIDPVIITALNKSSPFAWADSTVVNANANLSKIFGYEEKYGAINGYTFVLHDHNHNLALLSFITPGVKASNTQSMMENKKDKLQMLLIDTLDKFSLCYKEARQVNSSIQASKDVFTKRENEILYWASMGKTYQEIASILGLKTTTIKFHIGNAVKKLGVANAKHAIRIGIELQLIKPLL
ncbi:helix-turn-helix transcriptional regulator [Enterobacillus tribolii]|uniref:LuxR family quorum-sensing system transcriptional regulator ExpR n=1 Tax=Enterobacillus tribolii TaxID=1487935 RepID=A0A370QTX6_9GAMM|nr:LuxR family transcriptional regulator [Enterobacillus tribolii]MBW7981236.1 LuxR family transcriptional regulator [Enterobacillus tribolii]RDK92702.1 LuxR family quorum-sensing system transcriptional regulator ExpR [Enterobacillus tribolii]